MNSKIFLTGLMSLVMANASLAPALANPVIEQKRTEKQEVQDSSAQNSVVLTPATKDTPGAVQMIPVKDYIALKGEASLEGKQILEVMPQTSARNKNDKDSDKNNKSSLTPEADYFVVLPQGQELSATELEQVEGEGIWFAMGAGAAINLARTTYYCYTLPGARCGGQEYGKAAATGALFGAGGFALKGYMAGTAYKYYLNTRWMR
ncbi:hypothetical protein [Dolichospermum sp. UHCC 0259]|uniref:hypothetical protein n=1 Tax=Dolichospermum sp. UHCC 0259 TaxID=2590010 RepID=UPI001447FEAC|nr:hypothetical protein [Dolichospermum sp. UHCC 0259]MTJ48911.1 hypothetical protein [Dolichospermum sp. UHCC 0259]